MTRLLLGSAAFAMGAAALLAPVPATAQATQRYVEVYGDDPCPTGSDNEIVVCARKPESERYRIPERLRQNERITTSNSAPVRALDAGESAAGNRGTGSCSAAGAGSWTGCWAEQMRRAKAENAEKANNATPEF